MCDCEKELERLRASLRALADDLEAQGAAAELPQDFARLRVAERLIALLDGTGTPNQPGTGNL